MSGTGARLGILGGSGLYHMKALTEARTIEVETPFGSPSDAIVVGRLEGVEVAFLARHGRGHRLLPTEINYRANIYAMKSLGVEWLVAASAVGSLHEAIHPLDVVIPDQFIDRTRHRCDTFFGEGIVAHVSLADPFCADLARHLAGAARAAGARVHPGGTYLCMEGPQFSTRAESEVYRGWGAQVIGMTNLQEARLAREAELCFATLALVTDYDCWKTDEAPVSVEVVIERLQRNAALAERTLSALAGVLGQAPRQCGCGHALDSAIITAPASIPAAARERLGLIVERVLG
ncbi:MAG: S-methyl-5'-thioadenosine phosphorylase [Acidobacteriota bacterium]|nr:S-methyl-5'-thioadenosine phosphorylase [Acidobacteriota bacterium]